MWMAAIGRHAYLCLFYYNPLTGTQTSTRDNVNTDSYGQHLTYWSWGCVVTWSQWSCSVLTGAQWSCSVLIEGKMEYGPEVRCFLGVVFICSDSATRSHYDRHHYLYSTSYVGFQLGVGYATNYAAWCTESTTTLLLYTYLNYAFPAVVVIFDWQLGETTWFPEHSDAWQTMHLQLQHHLCGTLYHTMSVTAKVVATNFYPNSKLTILTLHSMTNHLSVELRMGHQSKSRWYDMIFHWMYTKPTRYLCYLMSHITSYHYDKISNL